MMPQVSVAALVATAQAGQLIGFPTDTVPALATRPEAAALIYGAKQRSPEKSLILMADSAARVWPYIQGSASERAQWEAIAAIHWPGALTMVLPASDRIPLAMHRQTPDYIGVRVPDCAIAQKILAQTGPLATTSINHSGQPPLIDLDEIESAFPTLQVLQSSLWPHDMENAHLQQPSTVVKWTVNQWTVLRQGSVLFTREDQ